MTGRGSGAGRDWALEPVTVYKLYVQIDSDGDGLTERWEVLLGSVPAGKGSGSRTTRKGKVLKREKVDSQPYCPFAANRLPSRSTGGRSSRCWATCRTSGRHCAAIPSTTPGRSTP